MLKQVAILSFSLILLAILLAPVALSQGINAAAQRQLSALMPDTTPDQRLQQEQMSRLFAERQTQLRIDTAKLLALTTELKRQVDKTDVNILSMDVVKKAQEIQKLAKSVQEKMKNGF